MIKNSDMSTLEQERECLNKLVNAYGLAHPLVIKQSERLDEVINQHYKNYINRINES